MNEPIYVAFSTQKGGAGKTTLTVLTASYLHYVKGYNVAVVDCDFPQYSIKDMRERDMTSATGDDHYKAMAYEQFKRLQKKAYPVISSRPEEKSVPNQMQPCGRRDKNRRKSGRSAARPRFRVLRPAGNHQQRKHCQYDCHNGLHILPHSRRPCRHGKFHPLCLHHP